MFHKRIYNRIECIRLSKSRTFVLFIVSFVSKNWREIFDRESKKIRFLEMEASTVYLFDIYDVYAFMRFSTVFSPKRIPVSSIFEWRLFSLPRTMLVSNSIFVFGLPTRIFLFLKRHAVSSFDMRFEGTSKFTRSALHEIVEILRTRARKVTTFESYIYTTNVCMFPRNNFLATMVDNIGLTITSIRYGRNLRLLAQRQYIYASNSAIASMCIGWKHIGERKIVTTSQSFFESFHESLKNIVKYRLNGGKITQSKAVIVFSRWLNNKIAFQSATTRRNVTYVLYLQQASK